MTLFAPPIWIPKIGVFRIRSYTLLSVFLVIQVHSLFGQGVLSNDLLYEPTFNDKLYQAPTLNLPTVRYSEQEKKQLKEALLKRVEETLFNLEDDSTGLKNDYIKIWGELFYQEMKSELWGLRNYLSGGTNYRYNMRYVPNPELIEVLFNKDVAELDIDSATKNMGYLTFRIKKENLLSEFLLNRHKGSLRSDVIFWPEEISIGYIEGWRQIEQRHENLLIALSRARAIAEDIFIYDADEFDELQKIADGNLGIEAQNLTGQIKKSEFLKKWLWYTGGVININPLLVTTPEKRYPYTEQNRFFSKERRTLQDSLNKLSILKQFTQTSYVHNRIQLPIESKKHHRYKLIEYDATKQYQSKADSSIYKYLENGQKLTIVVHNISASLMVDIKESKDGLEYQSEATKQFNAAADKLLTITSLGTSNLATIVKISKIFNPEPIKNRIQNRSISIQAPASSSRFTSFSDSYSKIYGDDYLTPRQYKVVIDGKVVPLTSNELDEDKRRILSVVAINEVERDDIQFLTKAIEAYIDQRKYTFLDYSNDSTLLASVEFLKSTFFEYLDAIKNNTEAVDRLIDKLSVNLNNILPYVRIYNRSLPPSPADLPEHADTTARFYTRIFTPTIPDAPQKFIYELTESTASGKGATQIVAKKEIKVIKTTWYDFSVGLGANLSQYKYARWGGSGLPTVTQGDRFQFVAGVHIYPFGRLNKLEDKGLPLRWSRLSIYVGLSIKNALDNFYIGPSYDIWPGIRLVAGWHGYKNERYKIVNNAVSDKASGLAFVKPPFKNVNSFIEKVCPNFVSINIEPATITKAIGLFR